MCASMADIHSATAEIRRWKKRKKEEETTGWKYNGLSFPQATIIKPTIALALRLCFYCTRKHMNLTIWNFTWFFLQFSPICRP